MSRTSHPLKDAEQEDFRLHSPTPNSRLFPSMSEVEHCTVAVVKQSNSYGFGLAIWLHNPACVPCGSCANTVLFPLSSVKESSTGSSSSAEDRSGQEPAAHLLTADKAEGRRSAATARLPR